VGLAADSAVTSTNIQCRRGGTLKNVDTRSTNTDVNPLAQTWVAGAVKVLLVGLGTVGEAIARLSVGRPWLELMVLADFCRNCLAKWYAAAAAEREIAIDYEQAREIVYGMPYSEWKDKYQREASPEQMAAYNAKQTLKE
jgi:hypothetical protein